MENYLSIIQICPLKRYIDSNNTYKAKIYFRTVTLCRGIQMVNIFIKKKTLQNLRSQLTKDDHFKSKLIKSKHIAEH